MLNVYYMNHRLQQITMQTFQRICQKNQIIMQEGDLKIILHIIKDNPYPLFDNEFAPVLLNEISRRTSKEVCNQFKPILENSCLIQEIV